MDVNKWIIQEYKQALRNEEIHGENTAYYRGIIWALSNTYERLNKNSSLAIDAGNSNDTSRM